VVQIAFYNLLQKSSESDIWKINPHLLCPLHVIIQIPYLKYEKSEIRFVKHNHHNKY